ncbi:MAG: vWA domain-containing protein [Polyangiales bacterium]
MRAPAFLALFVFGCSSAEGGGAESFTPAHHAADSGAPTTVDDDSSISGCSDCSSGQHCSKTGACIPDDGCAIDADCGPGLQCVGGKCTAGGSCGAESAEPQLVPPNLMIVLDRSCSMTGMVGTQSKWQVAIGALQKMLATYKGKVHFGITLFPDRTGDKCTQDKIPVNVSPASDDAIVKLLAASLSSTDANYPNGPCITNIDTAVQQAAAEPSMSDATHPRYMLLLTDGQQVGCSAGGGNSGTESTIVGLTKSGVKTYVVGYGSDVAGTDTTELGKFALYGGTGSFFKADDGKALDTALDAIAGATLSCTFALSKKPADPSKIYAFFDHTTPVARDPSNGFDYDPATNSVTFAGDACTKIKTQAVKRVDVVFGCNEPLPK